MTINQTNRTGTILVTVSLMAVVFLVYFLWHKQNHDLVFVQVKTFHLASGWGYNILVDRKVYIHQKYIPALPGSKGFNSENDALQVGQSVIQKIKQNRLPTVTIEELKGMGIVKDTLPSP